MIDLGIDPPLTLGGAAALQPLPIARAVSWRWLAGTVLTGVTSILLMGAALVAALNNPDQFASLPEALAAAQPHEPGGLVFGRKSDRMRPLEEPVSNRQVMQVSTVSRQGDRDFIKLKPFAKISTTLSAGDGKQAAAIPAFDMVRILADTPDGDTPDGEAPADTAAAVPAADGAPVVAAIEDQIYSANGADDVAISVRPFPLADVDLEPTASIGGADVEQLVRAAARGSGLVVDAPALAYLDPSLAADDDDPFAALGVRIVPENVSSIAKTGATGGDGLSETVVPVAAAGDLRALLVANGVVSAEADRIVAGLTPLVDVARLKPGQKVRLAFAGEDQAQAAPVRASVYLDGVHQATVARTDSNTFVRADEPPPVIDIADDEPTATPSNGLPTLYQAVYATALEQQVPAPLVEQLVRIFAFDVDLESRITPGDSMEVFHSLPDPTDREAADSEILFASLTLNGVTKRYYRFRTGDDGAIDYYDDAGASAKKFLIRKPVVDARITSGFGYRRHPILKERILHSGVDYAAPRGTPILAAGDGVVESAGPSSGYGNFTLIRHTNGYETAYGHQTRFAKGIVPGARVHQGQIIGYVGSTGLSTGPHLHFEIRINGKPVDPLRIRLPRGRVLGGEMLASFEHERERLDALLGLDTVPVASTKLAAVN
jgi:murein DD-endopeptidase MepM/ murein hydrolase activator NlpD